MLLLLLLLSGLYCYISTTCNHVAALTRMALPELTRMALPELCLPLDG